MLKDLKRDQEQWAAHRRDRSKLAAAWGEYLDRLADWDWFVTITFRLEQTSSSGRAAVADYLAELYSASGSIFWAMAGEIGAGGRFHCHLLITGVKEQDHRVWCAEAVRRFGRAEIEQFDSSKRGAFYVAKDFGRPFSNLDLGGNLGLAKQNPIPRGSPTTGHTGESTCPRPARQRRPKPLSFSSSMTPENPVTAEELTSAELAFARLVAVAYAADHPARFDRK